MSAVFKEGEVVVLKSSSPKMTLDYKTFDYKWACKWFDKDNNPQVDYFFPESLEYPKETDSE